MCAKSDENTLRIMKENTMATNFEPHECVGFTRYDGWENHSNNVMGWGWKLENMEFDVMLWQQPKQYNHSTKILPF